MTEEVPMPPQYKQPRSIDFRHASEGPRGFKVGVTKFGRLGQKRKLDEYAEQVERDEAAMEDVDVAAEGAAIGPIVKRPKHNTLGVGGVSGRSWKAPGQRAGSLRNPKLSTSWEKKMQIKAAETEYRERKQAATDARKEAAAEARARREAAKKRKEEARTKAAVVTRVSTETAKRMMKSKKQRKKLKSADVAA